MLRRFHVSAAAALIFSFPAGVRAQQTVTLSNGDRLSGALKTVGPTTWTLDYGDATVELATTEVVALVSTSPLGIRLADGSIFAATVTTSGTQLQLTRTDGQTTLVSPSALAAVGAPDNLDALVPIPIGLFSPFDRFWRATAGLGFSDKSGNSRSRGLAADLTVVRDSPRDRLTLRFGLAREESRGSTGVFETTVSKYFGSLRADIFLESALFVFAVTRQERDQFQDIDLRSTYDAGFGYQLIDTETTDLRFSLSGGARVENYTSGGSMTVGIVTLGTGLQQKLGLARFDWELDVGPSVENLTDYRLKSDATLTMSLFKGIGFRLGLLNEYDNTPRPGIRKHDMLFTSAVTYTIGQ